MAKVPMARLNQGHTMALHTYTPPNKCPNQVSIFYTLQFLKYSPDKSFQLHVTKAWLKVKSKLLHDIAYLHSQPISLPSLNFLHLNIFEIQPRQDFFCCHPTDHLAGGSLVKAIPVQTLKTGVKVILTS